MEGICLNHICKSFCGIPVLHNLSVSVPTGNVSCVMAPSGSGKTTLLRILMGLERADSGEILGLTGRRLSALFQEDRLCPWLTASDNIRLPSPGLSRKAVSEVMAEMGLQGCEEKRVGELSGGMCRRVALIRALLAEYDILLLDEPFKGLDQETKEIVIRAVLRYIEGKTVLLVTHDSREAAAMGAEQIVSLM